MEIIFFWIIFAVAVGLLAIRFGRSFVIWLFVSLVFSPLLAVIFLLILGTARKCPQCKGGIDKDAKKCRHCGSDITVTA